MQSELDALYTQKGKLLTDIQILQARLQQVDRQLAETINRVANENMKQPSVSKNGEKESSNKQINISASTK